MKEFLDFLLLPRSFITLIIPCTLSLGFILYELTHWKTDKKYLLVFAATLLLGLIANFWTVSTKNNYLDVELHIIPLFLCFSGFAYKKWKITRTFQIALGYLQVLFVDLSIAYSTDMVNLILKRTDLTEEQAYYFTNHTHTWYHGIGGGGIIDALSLVFMLPLLFLIIETIAIKLENKFKKNPEMSLN